MRSLILVPFLVLSIYLPILNANLFNSTAQAPALWSNNASLLNNYMDSNGEKVRAFLFSQKASFTITNGTNGRLINRYSSFACGFYCHDDGCNTFLFGIFIIIGDDNSNKLQQDQIIWSANRGRPVQENATVQLSKEGNVTLCDYDGTNVWSAGTSVASMTLFDSGNLVLLDSQNSIIWQSFDHPTDTLVLGQTLSQQKTITADASPTNSTPGLFYLSVIDGVLNAFAGYGTPVIYFSSNGGLESIHPFPGYNITFQNGILNFSDNPKSNDAKFIRLESDGHLRYYQWLYHDDTMTVATWNSSDILPLDYCDYPSSCGEYGVCSKGQCACPSNDMYPNDANSFLFRLINNWQPTQGCTPLVPLSCRVKDQMFLPLTRNVTYYNFSNYGYVADEESCKEACLKNCSCKVAFFDKSLAKCYPTPEILSISVSGSDSYNNYHNLSAFIKVQTASSSRKFHTKIVIFSSLGGLFFLLLTMVVVVCYMIKNEEEKIEEEDVIPQIPGMPRRFSLAQLKLATRDFSEKLGAGGFGSVFDGEIGCEKVAVKRLNSVSQGKKEFMTEMQTIGGINNVNLVRLIGYCVEKSERLLVYEYMLGGSLDKWIFDKRQSAFLDWNIRCKIILDVAKGLLYLHEDCRQRIAHLDIKPQNILLDDNLNAKVSDFGLAKLIDREQSHVMTRMRGTPGYLAPEWLTHVITEKADIYSFGVVVLEILCGRRNLDHTQEEENVHLISVLREKIRKNKLRDIIDKNIVFAEKHLEEIIRMMKLAMWCLESDSSRRPNMLVVVKILEGTMDFEADLQDHFFNATPVELMRTDIPTSFSSPPTASLLSGPR
jgi:Protein kinase domain/D-mannose binding lectin/S-locus glycoprotein domain